MNGEKDEGMFEAYLTDPLTVEMSKWHTYVVVPVKISSETAIVQAGALPVALRSVDDALAFVSSCVRFGPKAATLFGISIIQGVTPLKIWRSASEAALRGVAINDFMSSPDTLVGVAWAYKRMVEDEKVTEGGSNVR